MWDDPSKFNMGPQGRIAAIISSSLWALAVVVTATVLWGVLT